MKKKDPTSHRIIEKRRRDRMNNCLADLSKLIPAHYMRTGRGRVEKTEIIEMAIKHLKDLIETTNANQQQQQQANNHLQSNPFHSRAPESSNSQPSHPTPLPVNPPASSSVAQPNISALPGAAALNSPQSQQHQTQPPLASVQHVQEQHQHLLLIQQPLQHQFVAAKSAASHLNHTKPKQVTPQAGSNDTQSTLLTTDSEISLHQQQQQLGTLPSFGPKLAGSEGNTGNKSRYLCNNSRTVNHRNISNNRHQQQHNNLAAHNHKSHSNRCSSLSSSSSDLKVSRVSNGSDSSSNSISSNFSISTIGSSASSNSVDSYNTSALPRGASEDAPSGGSSCYASGHETRTGELGADSNGFHSGSRSSVSCGSNSAALVGGGGVGDGPGSNSSSSSSLSSISSELSSVSTISGCCTSSFSSRNGSNSSSSADGTDSGGSSDGNGNSSYSSTSISRGNFKSSTSSLLLSSSSSNSNGNRNHTTAWYKKAWLVRSFSPQR